MTETITRMPALPAIDPSGLKPKKLVSLARLIAAAEAEIQTAVGARFVVDICAVAEAWPP